MKENLAPSYILAITAEYKKHYTSTPWGSVWDEVFCEPVDQLFARFEAIVPATHTLTDSFKLPDGCNAAILCDSLKLFTLHRYARADVIIFAPNPLSMLDAYRNSRTTLVARRTLHQGELLSEDALSEQMGGNGVDVQLRDVLVGHRLAHDVDKGVPIDFGSVL